MKHRPQRRNLGPSWGYPFICAIDRLLPVGMMRAALRFGTWFALPLMPAQRQASREYLHALTGRKVGLRAVHRHFAAFAEDLWIKLRVGRGVPHTFEASSECPRAAAFEALARASEPALFGSLHVGQSDLAGYFLHSFGRTVHMVRLRVENSYDQERLAAQAGAGGRFIWVNDPSEMLFTLKGALEAGSTLALQCDRIAFGARTAPFRFLGERRAFPVTIYHLAWLYRRPVAFAFGFPARIDHTVMHASAVLPAPGEAAGREEYFVQAKAHFQEVLDQLEDLLVERPYQWFNYEPLNPVVLSDG